MTRIRREIDELSSVRVIPSGFRTVHLIVERLPDLIRPDKCAKLVGICPEQRLGRRGDGEEWIPIVLA